ncbi:MAG: hypothetical protein KJN90_04630 [Gammaproteobacteria bacterium]|nr:hypothetical protein [Gammaproteobacteria bacterium]
MTILKSLSLAAVLLTMLAFAHATYAQNPLTGTRLRSAGNANPRTTIQFEEPDQVSRIRNLLNQEKPAEALELALGYLEQVERAGLDTRNRYFAHNSLCVVYTYIRELEKAEEECSQAVEIIPGQWSAWNNRGTARYLAGDMSGAQQDFLRALEEAGDRQGVVDLLRHNLSLLDVPAPRLDQ